MDNFAGVHAGHGSNSVCRKVQKKMKRLLLFLFIPTIALASQTNPTREELLQTVKHIQALAIETQQELDQEKAAHTQTEAALAGALKANQDTQSQFSAYQDATEAQIKKGNEAISQLDHVIKKLHLAKWILCGIWLAFCALVALRIPGIGMYVGGGLAVAGIAFIWWWI